MCWSECLGLNKAHAHCDCCEAMHVSVHEQGVRSARRCMYERMCVCMNKEYVHAKLCIYAHIRLCVRE